MNPAVLWPDPGRQIAFTQWLTAVAPNYGLQAGTLRPASADASFRRYLRLQGEAASFIIMDAPPPHEDVRPFVAVAQLIHEAGLHAPQVLACDAEQGFLLLTDLGTELYLSRFQQGNAAAADGLMREALNALVQWQTRISPVGLPPFDETLLQRELDLFPQWCVQAEFGIEWSAKEQQTWQTVCKALIGSALAQPVVAVHRDWMPRNLMVSPPNPGILDFQDAVAGPVTYDLASMLRDAFLSWDEEAEIDWAARYWDQARRAGVPLGETLGRDFGEFWRTVEWMGLQRHLKVLGIFCRLKHRDGKPAYAQDLPRFFNYATKVALRYGPLRPLVKLLEPLSGKAVATGLTF